MRGFVVICAPGGMKGEEEMEEGKRGVRLSADRY